MRQIRRTSHDLGNPKRLVKYHNSARTHETLENCWWFRNPAGKPPGMYKTFVKNGKKLPTSTGAGCLVGTSCWGKCWLSLEIQSSNILAEWNPENVILKGWMSLNMQLSKGLINGNHWDDPPNMLNFAGVYLYLQFFWEPSSKSRTSSMQFPNILVFCFNHQLL